MLDAIPLWFAIPAAIVLWALAISPLFDIAEDPYTELSPLDELDGVSDRPRR